MTPGLADSLALLATAVGVVAALSVWVLNRSHRPALPILLDFLMAAGLLRLCGHQSWEAIGYAAVLLGVRKLVSSSIGQAANAHHTAQTSG